jgi:hypothetical protein
MTTGLLKQRKIYVSTIQYQPTEAYCTMQGVSVGLGINVAFTVVLEHFLPSLFTHQFSNSEIRHVEVHVSAKLTTISFLSRLYRSQCAADHAALV